MCPNRPFLLFIVLISCLASIHSSDSSVQIARDEVIFPPKEEVIGRRHTHLRRRWRRAPAVWGEPAPDYSAATLDIGTHIYLHALLFVDLKTSDHYRREHAVVRREVMRLATEANTYFFQINIRLLIVDILDTFRDDLSLYSFEQFRNQRLAQLPYHNFAVLISYRYAGGLAFVGGMCTGRNVMMAGFYPHNPEAMASIFFHEVAHLIGVPHRPTNESFAMPNCACPRRAHMASQQQHSHTSASATDKNGVSSASVIISEPNLTAGSGIAGCLKIPGFDHDCSLQWMINLVHQRNRCLPREPRPSTNGSTLSSLALCGNGVLEADEQCDCGLERMCGEWNCEPRSCSRKWPLWALSLFAFVVPFLALVLPLFGWFWHRNKGKTVGKKKALKWHWKMPSSDNKKALFARLLPSNDAIVRAKATMPNLLCRKGKNNNRRKQRHSSAKFVVPSATNRRWPNGWKSAFWDKLKQFGGKGDLAKLNRGKQSLDKVVIHRPLRPPPPPPPVAGTLPSALPLIRRPANHCSSSSSSASTLQRPKVPPPPIPLAPKAIVRPKALPPAVPKKCEEREEEERTEDDEEEDEWDEYCE